MSLLDLASTAANEAAALLRNHFVANAGIATAEGKDIKTLADRESQDLIIRMLASSGVPILGEEDPDPDFDMSGLSWIIDPLDGTMNFVRGFPMACVSIALWEDGEPVLGVIVDLAGGAIFRAEVRSGATLNGRAISVSDVSSASQAILACGFPSARNYREPALAEFIARIRAFKKIRMLGSAALMLAQVAAGRFDAYCEEDIYIWDVAAGLALVRAAGGSAEWSEGSKPFTLNVSASNGRLPSDALKSS